MKLRIAIWAVAGALVVLSWSLYFMAVPGNPLGNLWALAYLTCPIFLARSYPHPISVYFVLLVNAATYALIGMVVEIFAAALQTCPAYFILTHTEFRIGHEVQALSSPAIAPHGSRSSGPRRAESRAPSQANPRRR